MKNPSAISLLGFEGRARDYNRKEKESLSYTSTPQDASMSPCRLRRSGHPNTTSEFFCTRATLVSLFQQPVFFSVLLFRFFSNRDKASLHQGVAKKRLRKLRPCPVEWTVILFRFLRRGWAFPRSSPPLSSFLPCYFFFLLEG